MLYEDAEYLAENHEELAGLLVAPLNYTPCEWWTQEQCIVQLLDNIISLTKEGQHSRG